MAQIARVTLTVELTDGESHTLVQTPPVITSDVARQMDSTVVEAHRRAMRLAAHLAAEEERRHG